MENLKVYYDKNYVTSYKDNGYTFYNPINDKIINLNEEAKNLLDLIFESNGDINFFKIKDQFKANYKIDISEKDIEEVLNKLKSEKFFFDSLLEMSNERRKHLENISQNRSKSIKTAYIHLTLKCNFNCVYCYNKKILNNNYIELSTSKWKGILKELKEKGISHFIFTGGEPLLRRDLKEIIESIKDEKTYIEVLTNGSLLKDQFHSLIDIVDRFTLSLDSFDIDINSKNRSDIKYNNIISTLELFSEYNKDKVLVRSVVNNNNINDVESFSKKLYDNYGISSNHVWFIPNNSNEISSVPKFRKINNVSVESNEINFSDILNLRSCGAGSTIISIDPKGDVYPCQNLMLDEFKITNILNYNWYQDIMNNETTNKIYSFNVDDIEICGECEYRHICGGGCRAIAYKVYGDLFSHIKYFCEYLKEEAKETLEKSIVNWK